MGMGGMGAFSPLAYGSQMYDNMNWDDLYGEDYKDMQKNYMQQAMMMNAMTNNPYYNNYNNNGYNQYSPPRRPSRGSDPTVRPTNRPVHSEPIGPRPVQPFSGSGDGHSGSSSQQPPRPP